MVAVPLLFGRLTAEDYENRIAMDPRIDILRDKMNCVEDPKLTEDYHNPEKRAIANALTVTLNDGTELAEILVEYPIGHPRRREEGIPKLIEKYKINLARIFADKQQKQILNETLDYDTFIDMDVNRLVDLMTS